MPLQLLQESRQAAERAKAEARAATARARAEQIARQRVAQAEAREQQRQQMAEVIRRTSLAADPPCMTLACPAKA